MRVEVAESDVRRYRSEAESRAAHLARRSRFFAKPVEPTIAPLVNMAQWLPDASRPTPAPAATPLVSFVKPPEPSPLQKTILSIVDVVAAKLNVTAAEMLSDLTSSKAQMGRKISAAVAVRRLDLSPESAAEALGVVRGAVLDGLMIIDPVLRDLAIPRSAPLLDMVAMIFENSRSNLATPRPTIEEIQRVVATHFRVSVTDILSMRRTERIVRPRQIAIAVSKHLTLRSLPDIGRRFGGRDHTTALHAIRKYESALAAAIEILPADAAIIDWVIAVDHAFEAQPKLKRGRPANE